MRKLSFTMTLLLATVFVCGQKKEVSNAYNYYQNGYLDKAKEAIDKAILNEETAKEARTWMYRGNVYLRIADVKAKIQQFERDKADSLKASKPAPVETRDMKEGRQYINLCDNCAEIASDAYRKAFQIDPEIKVTNMGIATPVQGSKYCASFLYNEAVQFLGDKDDAKRYEKAHSAVMKANEAEAGQDHIVYLVGYTAELMNNKELAKTSYNEMIRRKAPYTQKPMPTKNVSAYRQLANIYKSENDTTRMLNIIEIGESTFLTEGDTNVKDKEYKDFVLVYSEYMSWAGKTDDVADVVNKALKRFPEDIVFLIAYGTTLSENEDYAKAEEYLKKALELKPDEPTAVFNLATCYYNNFVSIRKAMSNVTKDEDYKRLEQEANDLLEKARIEMEKAHELAPKDIKTLTDLKSIYTRMGKYEELKVINEKLDALK